MLCVKDTVVDHRYGLIVSAIVRENDRNVRIFSLGCFNVLRWDVPKNGLVPVLKSHGRGFVEKPYIRIVGKALCGHLFGVRQRIRVGKYQREKYDGGKSREGAKRNDEHLFNGSRLSLSFGFFAVCVFSVRFPHILLFPVFFFHISSFSTGRATAE